MTTQQWLRSARFSKAIKWAALPALALTLACYQGRPDGSRESADLGDDGPGPDDGGGTDKDPLAGPGECVDTKKFFAEKIARPLMLKKCIGCHSPFGQAKNTDLVLHAADYPGHTDVNYQTVENIAQLEIDGESVLLLKPTAQVEHEGGIQLANDSEDYENLVEMVERFKAPSHCVDDKDIAAFFTGVELLDEVGTLRKATFLLASRFPTADEIEAVDGQGIDALDGVLNNIMHEGAFYQRMREVFNDFLHTDAYLQDSDALDVLNLERWPNVFWFEETFGAEGQEDQLDEARRLANDAVAREGLHLAMHVLREDRPFTEFFTAPYKLVTPGSAQGYDVGMGEFENANNPDEQIEWVFEDLPYSGILTTPAFLARYPSTATNRNRHRARVVQSFFLGTDIMRLAGRPIDISSIDEHNAPVNNNQCAVCHAYNDPVAGTFQNWSDEGWYMPPEEGWHPEMHTPGFGDVELPYDQKETAVQWLAQQIINDPKFKHGMAQIAFKALTGQDPLKEPYELDAPDFLEQIKSFEAQDYTLERAGEAFVQDDYEFRTLVAALIKSHWFRAINTEEPIDEVRASELYEMGTARFLGPVMLHRRIREVTGYSWERNGEEVLIDPNAYLFYLGGTDSIQVTTPLTEINGVMANIVARMADEVACKYTALDFAKANDERNMWLYVDMTDTAGTAEQAIRDQVQFLHEHVLFESLPADDPELERTYQLFKHAQEDGVRKIENGQYGTTLPGQCQAVTDPITGDLPAGDQIIEDPDYTIRAWMAVMTYLLGEYEFLYL